MTIYQAGLSRLIYFLLADQFFLGIHYLNEQPQLGNDPMSKFFSFVAGACKFIEIMSSISAGAEKKQENRELRVSREILKAYATYSDVVSRDEFSARDARAVLHRLDCAEKDNHEYYISRVYAYLIPFHKESFDVVFTDRVEGKRWSESVDNVLRRVRWL